MKNPYVGLSNCYTCRHSKRVGEIDKAKPWAGKFMCRCHESPNCGACMDTEGLCTHYSQLGRTEGYSHADDVAYMRRSRRCLCCGKPYRWCDCDEERTAEMNW